MGQIAVEQVAAHLRRALRVSALKDVAALYIFGSCVEGGMRADSDIDVAVVAVPGVWRRPGWAPWHLEADIARLLRPLDGHPFDVTVLSPRNVRFAFRVIRSGQLVLSPDESAAQAFVDRTVRRFPDEDYRFRRALADVLPRVEPRR